jgi:uncharacterized UPF0160 family protein
MDSMESMDRMDRMDRMFNEINETNDLDLEEINDGDPENTNDNNVLNDIKNNDNTNNHHNDDRDIVIEKTITIQTHDKRFHADDVGAVSLLTSYYNHLGYEVNVIRSRNKDLMENSDILVDVGEIYSPETGRYDHHQTSCDEIFKFGCVIPLSSIGMVWKHYGKKILELYLDSIHDSLPEKINYSDHLDEIHSKVYFKIIQEIDAHDNGIASIKGGSRIYWEDLHLSSIINSYNGSDINDPERQMQCFSRAVNIFGDIFENKLRDIIQKYFQTISSFSLVKKAIDGVPEDQEYLIINDSVPGVYKCLNKLDPEYRFKFVIFCEEDSVTVKTRSRKENIYKPIVPLLSRDSLYNCLSDDERNDVIFVHKALFIGKTKTLEVAIKMVKLALEKRSPDRYGWMGNIFALGGITAVAGILGLGVGWTVLSFVGKSELR